MKRQDAPIPVWRRERLLAASLRASLMAFALIAVGCDKPPTVPSAPVIPMGTSAASPFAPAGWTSGTFTWTSIQAPGRTMCAALTSQVGHSWPLYLNVKHSGDSVTILANEDAPPDLNDPIDYAPDTWVGTLIGDTVSASLQAPNGGMACPSDTSITPETGGVMTATVSGGQIAGNFTAVYGTGANQVTFSFSFHAGFAPSDSRVREIGSPSGPRARGDRDPEARTESRREADTNVRNGS